MTNTPDIGIDLGTSNIVMTLGKKGVVLTEPSVIAYNTCNERILAVGHEADRMIDALERNLEARIEELRNEEI